MDFDLDECEIEASKHFLTKWMRKWDWDFDDLRDALRSARTVRVGKRKYKAVKRAKEGSRKIIFVHYAEFNIVFVISGAEGR